MKPHCPVTLRPSVYEFEHYLIVSIISSDALRRHFKPITHMFGRLGLETK